MRTALALACLLGAGCGPTMTIVSWEPGRLAPQGARTIVLVDGEGAVGPREIAQRLLVRQARSGWYRVETLDGARLTLLERAEVMGPEEGLRAIPEGAMWGRVDVIEWDTEDTTVEEQDEEGNLVEVPAQKSEVSLQVSIVARDGKVLLREQQYVGEVIVEEDTVYLGDPLVDAAGQAVLSLLDDITPKQVSQTIRLDDSDSGLHGFLENLTGNRWPLPVAERKLRRYIKRNPQNAIAKYNLAVLVDAMGRHDEALAIYDEAMRINNRGYYIEARAGCARRATAKRAVFGAPAPPSDAAPVCDAPPAR